MRPAALLLLLAVAWGDEPQGRHPIIPPGDSSPWCGTGRVWTGPLRVRVVCDGAPVEGIEVVLESGIGCTTDAKGIARFQSADSTDDVRIREAGYFPFEESVPEEDEELLVELKRGIRVTGRVLLSDGVPASGARAACWDEYGFDLLDDPQRVDADGRFTIVAVDKAKPFQLIVSMPGLAPVVIRKVLVREEPELTLKMGGPGGIEGVVTPRADVVYVRAAHANNPLNPRPGEERDILKTETAFAHPDAKGRYRIDGLALPGAYVVCAGPCESAVVELSPDHPRANVDIRSEAGPPRTIRILDERGRPLAEEWVALIGPARVEVLGTSARGALRLPPGDWLVDVDGYLMAKAEGEVKLARGITLTGVVTYPDGKAAPLVWVSLAQPLPGGGYRAHGAMSGPKGRFSISGLVEGDGWLTAACAPEGPHDPQDGRVRIHAGMKDVRVEIPGPARLAGRLLPPPSTMEYDAYRGGDGVVATLEHDGSFRVDGVPSGREVVLGFDFDGDARLELSCPGLAMGETRDLGTIRLDSSATLEGVVQDPAGHPIECAEVHVAVGEPYEPTYADEKGAFALPVHPVTPVVLEAGAPGFATRYLPVGKPGAAPLKIVLTPGAVVRGRVVDATGKAVPGAYIVFWRRLAPGRLSPFEDWKPETDSAGRFEVRLPPGTYHARFYDMAFSHARIPGPDVTVREGETKDLEIRLP